MPDNTYITPYNLSAVACLSQAPSQGLVYQLSDRLVIKLPYQYPVDKALSREDAEEQLDMSLRSFALFEKEAAFYDLLDKSPHPNIARRVPSKRTTVGIILERLELLESMWKETTRDIHFQWIMQLLDALERLELLGYTHGDLKLDNIGIDKRNQLQLYDFGSIMQCDEEGFKDQVLKDHSGLATCIHFLACGIDPFARVDSHVELRQRQAELRNGQGVVEDAARDFDQVIQAGWRQVPAALPFSELRKIIACIIGDDTRATCQLDSDFTSLGLFCNDIVAEKQKMWLDEAEYRTAWTAKGYTMKPRSYYI